MADRADRGREKTPDHVSVVRCSGLDRLAWLAIAPLSLAPHSSA